MARLTPHVLWGTAPGGKVPGGNRSILFNRMNVSSLSSGAMVEGMCRETPDEVAPVSTSGAESTQSEISEDWTLSAAQ